MIISRGNRRNFEINPLQCNTGLHESHSHPRLNISIHSKTNISLFAEYNQQDATFHNFFISVRRCTCSIPARLTAGSNIGLTNT